MSPALRSEVESFQHFIFSTIDSIVGALDGLSADELNWRPAAPATNSLYAIATHVLGNAEENLLGTLGRQPYTRNYAGEFIAAASAPDAVRASGPICGSASRRASRRWRAKISTARASIRVVASSPGATC